MNNLEKKISITAEEINVLPLRAFEGDIILIDQPKEISKAFEFINEQPLVGFDTETKPVFVRGHQNKVALMQIALPEKVYLIRLNKVGITTEIIHFLENTNILKAGIALRDDIKALQRLKKFEPQGIVELAQLAKSSGLREEGVKKLTGLLLGFRISKVAQTSNWEASLLNEKQLSYAATDAWVCLEIYKSLKQAM
ncbi:MAG: 3'-5' exonuclease domain protein [Cytophagales bacterium]|jgi:ribonuclease D|nr:3'-5' exonuclease domain-containing protein 2 [Bacteroidota bacterium]MBS1981478.1 3'-5' exonuclease domain-containing protein 2 [Bacteroidota bacterium]WHZ08587.1 MAG: 3'-5' exonuclease domain protein [Cytophagales bacterium]